MTSTTDLISRAAYNLQISAPKEWDAFVQVFDAYTLELALDCAQSDSDKVLVQQGKTRMLMHLLKTFRECGLVANRPQPQQTQQP